MCLTFYPDFKCRKPRRLAMRRNVGSKDILHSGQMTFALAPEKIEHIGVKLQKHRLHAFGLYELRLGPKFRAKGLTLRCILIMVKFALILLLPDFRERNALDILICHRDLLSML
jgi:hypothetical protein